LDLATGALIKPLFDHIGVVEVLATEQLGGRPVVISISGATGAQVWDLATGAPIGQPLTGHASEVYDVATAKLDGRLVIISGGYDSTIRTWDLATRVGS
jgi:WD40 repeat protein